MPEIDYYIVAIRCTAMNDKIKITIRKALASDIDAVAAIYDRIHTWEEKGKVTIGWERGVYPERITAETALAADELFVMEEAGVVVGTGIINQTQVDVYEKGNWKHPAEPTEVMVLHTLVIDPEDKGRGLGRRFVRFYEDYARQEGCKYLRLDTNSRNTSARALYKSMGYEEIGCVPCVFNGLEDVNLVLIEKAL